MEEYQDVLSLVKGEIEEFYKAYIDFGGGYTFKQYEVIENVYRYLNQMFLENIKDDEGVEKLFYDVISWRCEIATKEIDIDLKDIRVVAEEASPWYAFCVEKLLKHYLQQPLFNGKDFSHFLNEVCERYPAWGHVVAKKVKDKIYLVDLRNLVCDPTAPFLQKSNFIIERHFYTPLEFQKLPFPEEKKQKVLSLYKEGKTAIFKGKGFYTQETGMIEVWERYGLLPESAFGKNSTNPVLTRCICSFAFSDRDEVFGIMLSEPEIIDEIPYKEVKWEEIEGRWLGRGLVEKAFYPIRRINEIMHQKRKGFLWSSIRLFQTRDPEVESNALIDAKDGEVIKVSSEIRPIPMENRDISALEIDKHEWETLLDNLTFSYDIIKGEKIPAKVPLGTTILRREAISKYFGYKREKLALFIKEILYDWVLPELEKMNKKEVIFSLTGISTPDELESFKNAFIEEELKERIIEYVDEYGEVPDDEAIEVLKRDIERDYFEGGTTSLIVPPNFLKEAKFKIDVNITGERVDVAARLDALQVILQTISSQREALKDKRVKRLIGEMLQLLGVSPALLEEKISETEEYEKAPGKP